MKYLFLAIFLRISYLVLLLNINGGLFCLFGFSTLLGLNEAKAQETSPDTESIKKELKISPATIDNSSTCELNELSKMADYFFKMQDWPAQDEFIKFLSEISFVKIVKKTVTPADFYAQNMAFFSPDTGDITVYLYEVDENYKYKNRRRNELKEFEFQVFINNQALILRVWHELIHKINSDINFIGLNFEQIKLACFVDEVSAKSGELWLVHRIWLNAENISHAFKNSRFEISVRKHATGMVDNQAVFTSDMFQEWYNHLLYNTNCQQLSDKDMLKMVQIACHEITVSDSDFYSNTLQNMVRYRAIKNVRASNKAIHSKIYEIADIGQIMAQMLGVNNPEIINLINKEFLKIRFDNDLDMDVSKQIDIMNEFLVKNIEKGNR